MRTIGAFLRRDARIALSYRTPFVLEILSAAGVLVMLSFFGKLVPAGTVEGGYFSFAAVGIALLAFVQAGLGVGSSNFRQEQVQGTLEVVLSTGLSTPRLAGGMVAYPMAFAAVRAATYAALGIAMGAALGGGNWGLALAAVGLAAMSFAGLGLVAAALVVVIRQAAAAVALLVTLLALGAGAGFPRDLLPGWAQTVAEVSPLTHALDVVRGALLGGASWRSSLGSLAALVGLAVASAVIGLGALTLALRWARRRGGLGTY